MRNQMLVVWLWSLVQASYGCHGYEGRQPHSQTPTSVQPNGVAPQGSSLGGQSTASTLASAGSTGGLRVGTDSTRERQTTPASTCSQKSMIPPEILESPEALRLCFDDPDLPLYDFRNLARDGGYETSPPRHEDCDPNDNFCVPPPKVAPLIYNSGRGEYSNCWGVVNLIYFGFAQSAGIGREVTARERRQKPNICCYRYRMCR